MISRFHTERAVSAWMKLSRRNVLVPNPEWLELSPAVPEMDAVLCKTRWTGRDHVGNPSASRLYRIHQPRPA
jgi:hypothetical protein